MEPRNTENQSSTEVAGESSMTGRETYNVADAEESSKVVVESSTEVVESSGESIEEPASTTELVSDLSLTLHNEEMRRVMMEPFNFLNDIENISEVMPNIKECPVYSVEWHRSKLKDDMITTFKDQEVMYLNIDVTFIGYNGKAEEGKGGGVFRDALTTFWNQFFNSLAIGAQEKIPSIRHDYQKGEWEAIARILVYGYVRDGYYPLSLSLGFLVTCLFGDDSISNEFLLSSFRQYISEDERDALDKCLEDNFVPDEDILDFLGNYKCYRNPSEENIRQIISELAHQEIIQKPRYVLNCWAPILKSLKLFQDFKCIKDVENMYDAKRPTAKKVLKLIKSEPATDQERQCLDHLKKYVRSLQGNLLPLFLQFVTGSDVICFPNIEVSFTLLEGAARRPVAHACGPLLEIPSTYQSYNELSEEFSELLANKEAWTFNIV